MAEWPTHRSRATQARRYRRWLVKSGRRLRKLENAGHKPAPKPSNQAEPITDGAWSRAHNSAGS